MEKIIEPNVFYSLNELDELNVIPFSRALIVAHIERGNIVASAFGTGNGRRYKVKGSNVIQFLAKLEAGDFR